MAYFENRANNLPRFTEASAVNDLNTRPRVFKNLLKLAFFEQDNKNRGQSCRLPISKKMDQGFLRSTMQMG